MTRAVFDHDQFLELLRDFGTTVPPLLRENPVTADLAEKVQPIREAAEGRFTVAVVGQMRSGKSSLLNALIGQVRAVVGVNETTATINLFRYGEGKQTGTFRVTWEDGSTEDLDIAEIKDWVGDSEKASRTSRIDFFTDSEFLKVANIVDTPGTRSVIGSHEDTVRGFLLEEATIREGERADAILYVLPPVAGATDEDLLREFDSKTRLPGSSPYNSIAVLHKWETLNADDPYEEARRKAETASRSLDKLVSKVVPVSAPLAWAAEHFPDGYFGQILELVGSTSPATLQKLAKSDRHFCERTDPECPLNPAARKKLFRSEPMPWPSFRHLLRIAGKDSSVTPAAFRAKVAEAGGLADLKEELENRFFARSRMIKCFSKLAKAIEPCRRAQIRLQNQKARLANALEQAALAKVALKAHIDAGELDLSPALSYILETEGTAQRDQEHSTATLRALGGPLSNLVSAYEEMEADVRLIETLREEADALGLPVPWPERLATIFGASGPDLESRLGFLPPGGDPAEVADAIVEAIGGLRTLLLRSDGRVQEILAHGIDRLEAMLDEVER